MNAARGGAHQTRQPGLPLANDFVTLVRDCARDRFAQSDTTTDMSDVLKRKLGARQAPRPPAGASVEGILRKIMPRDADAVLSLDIAVTSFSTGMEEKAELLGALGSSDLAFPVQSGDDARGLVILDGALVSALIEVQVAGSVSPHPPVERMPTRTDGIVVGEVVDRWLSTAEAAVEEAGLVTAWPLAGFERIPRHVTRREAELLLEPGEFRLIEIGISIDGGKRDGCLRLAAPHALLEGGKNATLAARVRGHLPDCRVQLRAVLARIPKEVHRVRELKQDDVVVLPEDCLRQVRIETLEGRLVGKAQLGQFEGKKAVRLSDGGSTHATCISLPQPSLAELAVDAETADGGSPDLPDPTASPARPGPTGPPEALPDLPDLPDPADLPDLPPLP